MGGLATPKGGKTTTTTEQSKVPSYVSDAQQNTLNAAQNVLSPHLNAGAFTTAGPTTDSQGGYDLNRFLAQSAFTSTGAGSVNAIPELVDYRNEAGWQAPAQAAQAQVQGYAAPTYSAEGYKANGYQAATAAAPQVTGDAIRKLLNPYVNDVVDTTNQTARRQYEQTRADLGARSAAAGAFGGSRQAIQSAQLDRSFGEQVASTTAGLMSQGYDKATATALANAQIQSSTNQFNASAQNQAGQFNAGAQNTAAQFGAGARNTAAATNAAALGQAAQFGASANNAASATNATAQNSRDEANAGRASTLLQNRNTTALQAAQADQARVTLEEALRSGDFSRQMQAVQALLASGREQQATQQAALDVPLTYLKMLGALTPQQYDQSTTKTAPNSAPSPLQTLLGVGTSLLTAKK